MVKRFQDYVQDDFRQRLLVVEFHCEFLTKKDVTLLEKIYDKKKGDFLIKLVNESPLSNDAHIRYAILALPKLGRFIVSEVKNLKSWKEVDTVSLRSTINVKESVISNNYHSFLQLLPESFKETQESFNDLRRSFGLAPRENFFREVEIKPSKTREQYLRGEIYNIGEEVFVKSLQENAKISRRGTNYLIVKTSNKETHRVWLRDVKRK